MTTIKKIPLKNLAIWDGNVRKTGGPGEGLAELAASIRSVGVINPLTVFPKGRKHLVVAGGRRLAALQRLADEGAIDESYDVPCTVTSEAKATEISIAENVVREHMHPADEFEGFLTLSKDGVSNEDIAARFGVSAAVVARRLKLARVSPKIIAAYRGGDLDLECVMAYAVTDDVKRQNKVFKALTGYGARDAGTIRSALTEGELDASDKRVRFVTLDAYEQAGGRTHRDLFATDDDESGTYILDLDILEGLVASKLEAEAEAIRNEGWKWVEVRRDFGWDEKSRFRQLRERQADLPPHIESEAETIGAELDGLYDVDELTAEHSARIDEINARLEEIDETRELVWPEGTFDAAGAILSIGYQGELNVVRGLVRPEDARALSSAKPGSTGTSASPPAGTNAVPARLTEQLSRHRTAALAAELLDRPDAGLALVAYCLALEVFTHGKACAHLYLRRQSHHAVEGSAAYDHIERAREAWGERIPGSPDMLWTWCLAQDQAVLIELITFCAAMSVDAIIRKRGTAELSPSLGHADGLARALGLDMRRWFTPTANNFFAHISKALIAQALREAKGEIAPAWLKVKKLELAGIAEREIAGTGWLPEILRAPSPAAGGQEAAA